MHYKFLVNLPLNDWKKSELNLGFLLARKTKPRKAKNSKKLQMALGMVLLVTKLEAVKHIAL